MSGRAYTMKEMRAIVDYLVERKAFSEIRGRKMWKDYASSGLTTRTWQSLKETFLKRILHDIHNPYYKLSPEIIRSFREGKYVVNKTRNQLQLRNSVDGINEEDVTPCTSASTGQTEPGEDNIHSNLTSDGESTETIILKSTNEGNPEDREGDDNQNDDARTKSLRECISFSDPMAPKAPKSSQILEVSRSTTINSHKSDLHNSVPDSLLPNNQEGLEDLNHKETLPNPLEEPTLSPKEQEKTTTSSNTQEKAKKKINTTLKKKKEPAEPTENAEHDKVQKISKPGDTQIDGNDCIMIIDSENNNGTDRGNEAESDIPNNRDESECKLSSMPHCEKEHDKEKREEVSAKKCDDIEVVQATQSQPLLQSVSLYEENSSTESDLVETSKQNTPNEEVPADDEDILNLTSDSNDCGVPAQSPAQTTNNLRMKRKRHLNNLYDKNNDPVDNQRRRYKSQSRNARPIQQTSSDSSQWSSTESDCEFVSPPRSRGRHTKKYLKPKSLRLHSLQQEGGLFVACGKKIYPLIDDSKGTPTFLSYLPEDYSDEEEVGYWKLKYVEERKKTAELLRMRQEFQNRPLEKQLTLKANSPILTSKTYKINVGNNLNEDDVEVSKTAVAKQVEKTEETRHEEKTVKLKYTKNNEEISLEGQWPNVHLIINDVIQLINKDRPIDNVVVAVAKPAEAPALAPPPPPPVIISGSTTPDEVSKTAVAKQVEKTEEIRHEENTVKLKYAKNNEEIEMEGKWPDMHYILNDVMPLKNQDRPIDNVVVAVAKPAEAPALSPPPPVIISGSTTPDEAVRRRVNDIENAILLQILERDRLEEINQEKPPANNKRKGKATKRPAPPLQPAVQSSKRRSKKKPANADDSEIIVNEAKLKPIEPEVASSHVRKSTKSPKVSTQDKTSEQNVSQDEIIDEDSEILYKFPSPKPDTETMNDNDAYKNAKKPSPKIRLLVPLSEESTLGYQDSDGGSFSEVSKKKKPLSTIGHRNKIRRNIERKAYEYSNSDASNECSMSLPSAPRISTKINNSTLNTDAYRSESYQILIPMAKRIDSVAQRSQKASPCPNEMDSTADTNSLHLSPASQNMDFKQDKSSSSISIQLNSEPASSSSVSLPLSPELSIVENISLSKSSINLGERPTINEIQAYEDSLSLTCDKFALSQVDVTMPLMEQECLLRKSAVKSRFSETAHDPTTSNTYSNTFADGDDKNIDLDINANKRGNTVSETLLNKLDTVSIGDNPSFVNSLDGRMKNLLLNSAKKAIPTRKSTRGKENIDDKMEVDNLDNKNKIKQKKRCSTPRKRQNIVKSQPLLVDGIIEEETMESCASGRKSCPAVFSTIKDVTKNDIKSKSPDNVTVRKTKTPKQIIKVKILRPKPKKSLTKAGKAENGRLSKQSVRTDSGINDTTCSRSLNLNETVEFIHNHSETCLQASECLDSNSVQILSSSKSIISLTTSSLELDDGLDKLSILSRDSSGLPPEMYCADARDGSFAMKANIEAKPPSQNSGNEYYHTPPASVSSLNSLITEDLSGEMKPSKPRGDWFLLSDEDATTTVSNLVPAPNTVDNNSIYNAYLKRLFPMTCAVPDLSTITEASKDTDSQSRQNPTSNTAEFNNALCSEHLSDEDFLSCQS